jgi:hypothetical protein
MGKLTFDRVEQILNQCGVPDEERNRVPKDYRKLYGTWLRKNDKLKFHEEFVYMTNILLKVNNIRKEIKDVSTN